MTDPEKLLDAIEGLCLDCLHPIGAHSKRESGCGIRHPKKPDLVCNCGRPHPTPGSRINNQRNRWMYIGDDGRFQSVKDP